MSLKKMELVEELTPPSVEEGTAQILVVRPDVDSEGNPIEVREVVLCKPSKLSENMPTVTKWAPFDPKDGDGNAEHYDVNGKGELVHAPPPPVVVPPRPRPEKFLLDCTADSAVPNNAKVTLHMMGSWIKQREPQLALALWQMLKASLGDGPAKTAIRNHAAANNIDLPN